MPFSGMIKLKLNFFKSMWNKTTKRIFSFSFTLELKKKKRKNKKKKTLHDTKTVQQWEEGKRRKKKKRSNQN